MQPNGTYLRFTASVVCFGVFNSDGPRLTKRVSALRTAEEHGESKSSAYPKPETRSVRLLPRSSGSIRLRRPLLQCSTYPHKNLASPNNRGGAPKGRRGTHYFIKAYNITTSSALVHSPRDFRSTVFPSLTPEIIPFSTAQAICGLAQAETVVASG